MALFIQKGIAQGGRKPMKSPVKDQKRADYYLYTWQIREVQRISRETRTPPSEVMRELLSRALEETRQSQMVK